MITPSLNRCGTNADEQKESPNCSSGKFSRTGPAIILALALAGLALFPLAVAAVVLASRLRRRLETAGLPESRLARIGLVLGAAGIFTGLIQLMALVYLLPTLLGPGIREDEKAAASALCELHRVQTNFRKLTGKFAPGLNLLRQRGFLDSNFKEPQAYQLELSAAKNLDTYQARAIPRKPGLRFFFIDHSGILRRSNTADIGPHSPVVEDFPAPKHPESP